jgi:hypothetical protein
MPRHTFLPLLFGFPGKSQQRIAESLHLFQVEFHRITVWSDALKVYRGAGLDPCDNIPVAQFKNLLLGTIHDFGAGTLTEA